MREVSRLDGLGHRGPLRPRGAQQQAQQDALERGLAVDAVVVGAAEEDLRISGSPQPELVVVGARAGARRARSRGSRGRRRPRTWPPLPSGPAARSAEAALLLGHDRAGERGQAVAADERHLDGAGVRAAGPGRRGRRGRAPAAASRNGPSRPSPSSRSGGAPTAGAEGAPAEALPGRDVVQVGVERLQPWSTSAAAPRAAAAAGRRTACARSPTRPASCRRGRRGCRRAAPRARGCRRALGTATRIRLLDAARAGPGDGRARLGSAVP